MGRGKDGLLRSRPVWVTALVLLAAALGLSLLAAVTIGSTDIPLADVYHVIAYQLFGAGDSAFGEGTLFRAVWYLRLPRLILAAGIGGGLAVCGVVMQAVVKNPLADPYVLGISSGASLGATLAIMAGVGAALGENSIGVMAFLGAFGVSILVVTLANVGGRASSVKLLLAGMAVSSVCGAFSNFIVYTAHDREGMQTVTYWLMGSMAGADWERDAAVLLVAAAIVGFAVYAAGMIGFVGLVVPHVMRMLFGTDHKKLIPLCALAGAVFLIWADVACRVIIPGTELPIGILTSMIGAPCFIYLMARKKYGFGGGD